jgi:hypothetical protein
LKIWRKSGNFRKWVFKILIKFVIITQLPFYFYHFTQKITKLTKTLGEKNRENVELGATPPLATHNK